VGEKVEVEVEEVVEARNTPGNAHCWRREFTKLAISHTLLSSTLGIRRSGLLPLRTFFHSNKVIHIAYIDHSNTL